MSDRRVEWIRAQLDATEAAAKAGMDALGDPPCWPDYQTYDSPELGAAESYLAHFSPADMLADVEAKRDILDYAERIFANVEKHPDDFASKGAFLAMHGVVKWLAEGFRNRPGYAEACGE